jgi:hypothetical protein
MYLGIKKGLPGFPENLILIAGQARHFIGVEDRLPSPGQHLVRLQASPT